MQVAAGAAEEGKRTVTRLQRLEPLEELRIFVDRGLRPHPIRGEAFVEKAGLAVGHGSQGAATVNTALVAIPYETGSA